MNCGIKEQILCSHAVLERRGSRGDSLEDFVDGLIDSLRALATDRL